MPASADPEPLPAPIAPLSEHEAAALAPLRDSIAGLVAKYPFIGECGNLAGVRFFEFFGFFRDTGTDLGALVQLITVYPTRAVRLACDADQ